MGHVATTVIMAHTPVDGIEAQANSQRLLISTVWLCHRLVMHQSPTSFTSTNATKRSTLNLTAHLHASKTHCGSRFGLHQNRSIRL